ncbi:MAG: hypothetical protein A3B30_00955 [Candidatus Komeilibacteria bacterium RIFCSPLOWO2_01_FULL_52_15]|uniref:FtsK domain-containing protein n=1 Tax=Candidatus Komeilibacteria bacterium RIFCSPLOWO2_01_FULL_52_15 TaxID=1798551 RepID=A0A1G2BUU4_9BACT|nr:MAG: hypothetical protein A3B30_00955 [Candidatus Komeilibacteria bacterium RIFCSPLOWO2_01_FULL_52_15]
MLNNRSQIRRRVRRNRSLPTTRHFALPPETKRGIAIVIIFTAAFITLLSFFHATGSVGDALVTFLGKVFGMGAWLVPVLVLIIAYQLLRPSRYDVRIVNYIGLVVTIASYCGLAHLSVRDASLSEIMRAGAGGGLLGYAVGNTLYRAAELWGSVIILLAFLLIGFFMFLNTSFATIVSIWRQLYDAVAHTLSQLMPRKKDEPVYENRFETAELTKADEPEQESEEEETEGEPSAVMPRRAPSERQKPRRIIQPKIDIPLDLLSAITDTPTGGDIKAGMKKIEETLKSFGIEVTMGEVNVGPTVTQYTLKPMEGVKLTQITALQNDLALALAAHPIRIEAPIPGKSLVGIEVPNQTISIVRLREILASSVYAGRRSNLMLSLGKDVSGRVMMADLGKMPHLLIAGATGSGKSVSINSMLISLLYQNGPDMLKLILVDPKRVELTSYDGIPHLLTPVIIDIEKTINALRWTVERMDERYRILSAAGKKNIDAFNEARLVEKMPYIVIIIDELADLMMVAAKEVESCIIRLAQMARAVGIHLILATQRPSVNVITGLIKANITSRIAFAVASQTDSRTIIDSSGAEKLLGNGDMLYISAELSKPKRIQGAFVNEKEISAVTDYLKEHGKPEYEPEVIERRRGSTSAVVGGFESSNDEREMREAALVVIKAKRASATLLQSRMRVGFAKGSRLLDLLEDRGIIGPQNSSKPREVLITEEELDEYFGSGTDSPAGRGEPEPDETEGEDFEDSAEAGTTDELDEAPTEEHEDAA